MIPAGRPICLAILLCAAGACTTTSPDRAFEQPQANTCSGRLSEQSSVIIASIQTADGREIPVELHLPAKPGTYPLIGFSHGALAAPDRYHAMLRPLAAAGYIIVAPMHRESEEFTHQVSPSQIEIWNTRVEDLALALDPPPALSDRLAERGYAIDHRHKVAMGHSYGALMAQFAGGARGFGPDGKPVAFAARQLSATIAWSPPGVMPGTIEADGWATLEGDALVLTGTADQLTVMQKDWRWHTEGYGAIPSGGHKMLWVGADIDHYFGGSFGREKTPNAASLRLFDRALLQTLAFLDRATVRPMACNPGPAIAGESIVRD
ncbi:hypothetical protein MACH24_09180 [Erythrobacter sp. Dej080120_24]|uniref:alpha/beta hydrolase family protein n=1 Tax=Erythrobacter sp. Dej080120_24 TaxID=3024837 RepID=UPI00291FF342|nr:hypothetical protein MACH24_09180 [Erythrobacter sp. Dej080120_24]